MNDEEHRELINDRHLAAVHEAAHAVLWDSAGIRVKGIDLGPTGGLSRTNKDDIEIDLDSDESILRFLVPTVGGPVAEAPELKATGRELDDGFAWAIARDRDDIEAIFEVSGRTREQFQTLVTEAKNKALDLLSEKWRAVSMIAQELEHYGRLDEWRVRRIIHERGGT